jgi:glyoxylase-like metal-dependent hydrolase (beta-lactamase superfamily II)
MIRRAFGVLLLCTVSAAPAAEAPLPFTLKQVGTGVYAAIDGPEHKSGANAGFVIGDDGVLVIDSFFYPDSTRALVAEIHRLTDKPIRYVVNTHYHVDHTGGDAVLKQSGATIIAHRNVRAWVHPENIHLLGDRITPNMKAQIEEIPLPDVTTTTGLTIWLGSREVVVRPVLGHTGGDLDVYVPDSKVLFTGDLLWRKIPPNLIDGSVKEWTATDADFIALPDAAHIIFVPGHGDVADVSDVKDFRQYLLDLKRLVAEGREAGLKSDALTAFVEPKLKSLHPDWTISDRSAAAEVRYMSDELAGTKRRPVPMPPPG